MRILRGGRGRGPLVGALAIAAVVSSVAWASSRDDAAHEVPNEHTDVGPGPVLQAQRPPPDPASAGRARTAVPAPTQVDAHRPTALELPSGVSVPVDTSATASDGQLAIPSDVGRAGWWDGSSRLGDPFGAIVVAAHVDSYTQGLGRFAELLTVHEGDLIRLRAGALDQRFLVVSAGLVPKSAVDAASDYFSVRGAARLVLITCGGEYDQADGGYQDNVVVVAVPSGRLHGVTPNPRPVLR